MHEQHAITADWYTLMDQAPGTVDHYLGRVIDMVDRQFGDGYAQEHPELVSSLVTACCLDFLTSHMGVAAQKLASRY